MKNTWRSIEQPESDRSDLVEAMFECLEQVDLDLPERSVPPQGREQAFLIYELEGIMRDAELGGVFPRDQEDICTRLMFGDEN